MIHSATRILLEMLKDLKDHHKSKNQLLTLYVEKRLERSLTNYYKELTSSVTSLSGYNEQNVLQKLAKRKIKD